MLGGGGGAIIKEGPTLPPLNGESHVQEHEKSVRHTGRIIVGLGLGRHVTIHKYNPS